MTTTTSSCEQFEIAALRQARGALDAEATARLATHLVSCAGCRDFAATASATEAAMRLRVREASAGRDWETVRARFWARRRLDRNRKLRGLASFVLIFGLTAWSLGPVAGTGVALFAVAMLAIGWWRVVLPEQRRARAARSVDADLLAFYRRDLDQELARLRGSRLLVVVMVVLFASNLVLMLGHVAKEMWLGHGFPDVQSYVATFVVFAVIGGMMWCHGRYRLPRLERERRELGA